MEKVKHKYRNNPKALRELGQVTSYFAPVIALTTKSPVMGAMAYGLFNWWGTSIVREPFKKALESAENPRRGRQRQQRLEESGQQAFVEPLLEPLAEGVAATLNP